MRKFLLVVFLTFAASFTPIAAKYVVNSISPLSLAFLRFGVATLMLLVVSYFMNVNFKIKKEDRLRFLVLGALVIPINQFCFLEGIKLSVASHSGVLYACTPLIVYLVSIKAGSESYSKSKLISISLTIAGIFIIFYENIFMSGRSGVNYLLGDILLFLAVASWSVYLALSRDMVSKYGPLKTQTLSFTIGIIMFIPIFVLDLKNLTFENSDFYTLLGYLHLTIIVAFGSYFLYSYSSKVIETSTLTTMTNMSPVVTILFSWLLLNENLSYFFIIGATVTILGVFFAQKHRTANVVGKTENTEVHV
jgi:drug/metabolite transporter (DMT)-like permease